MSVCVFLGPTLPAADAAAALDAAYLPPVRLGDVHRAVSRLEPRAVGIVDGYFQWAPAVWHKEILWAIDRGVHVFGAGSIGALRAAELAPLGMRGVGRIFEAYREGRLEGPDDAPFEDDDEVAVIHGPPETGYAGLSEAMVNIRCTLALATREGVIGEPTRCRLVTIAKAAFFLQRDYPSVLRRGRDEGLPEAELASLEHWLPSGRLDQKRLDAAAMLAAMRDFIAGDPPPGRASFTFEATTLWQRAEASLRPPVDHGPAATAVLAELRVDAPRYRRLRDDAWRALLGPDPDEAAADAEAARRLRAAVPAALVERRMLALLREADAVEPLRLRAERKRSALARSPLPEIDEFSELQLLELRDWYFTRVAEREMPDDLDQWTLEYGHADLDGFHRAIFAEFAYRRLSHDDATGSAP